MSLLQFFRLGAAVVRAGAKADRQRKSAAIRAAKARNPEEKRKLSALNKELRSISKQIESLEVDAKIIRMVRVLENSK